MTLDEYKAKKARGEITLDDMGIETEPAETSQQRPGVVFDDFLPLLIGLLSPRQHLVTPPTFVPQNLLETVQLYDDGTDRRIYWFINNTWRYSTLT